MDYLQYLTVDVVLPVCLIFSLCLHIVAIRKLRILKDLAEVSSLHVDTMYDRLEELSKKVKYKPLVIEEVDIKYCSMLEGYLENIIKCFDVLAKNPSGEQKIMYGRKLRGEILRVKQIYKVNVETISLAKQLLDKILKDKGSM